MKTARSTTHRLMIRILEKMSGIDPIPLPRLAEKLEMPESNLRRALNAMETEGLQIGTPEFQEFFAWAKTEKEALLNLARINKGTSGQKAKAEAV